MPEQAWVFPCQIERVIDGDTMVVYMDLGMETYKRHRIRLLGVNTPEMKGTQKYAGREAKEFVTSWVQQADGSEWPFLVETHKVDNFGRYLGKIWRRDTGACLSDVLIDAGYATKMSEGGS